MSLTARIALEPSREVAWLERAMPLAGIVVAATACVARWPAATAAIVAVAAVAAALVVGLGRGRAPRHPLTIAVSDSSEIALVPDGRSGAAGALREGGWRLTEDTLHWPSLAVVALADDAGGPALRIPVSMHALRPADRWALARFLGWSLRSGRPSDERRVP